jgi:hypothetical protein
MKAFSRCFSSREGGSSRLKNTLRGLVALALLTKAKGYITRERDFERKVQLVFPHYKFHSE